MLITSRIAIPYVAVMLIVSTTSCIPQGPCDADGNGEYNKAMLASPTIVVKDEVGDRCDTVDWRYIRNFEDANATITVRIGDPFKGHKMKGMVSLYDIDAMLLQQSEIRQNESRYEFRQPIEANKYYYIKMEATEGKASYNVETRFDPVDPCAKCPEGWKCAEGKCVEPGPAVPCGGACPTGSECDPVQNRCVPVPCGGECPDGYICSEKLDKCVKEPCRSDKDCARGRICKRGRCIKEGPVEAPKPDCTTDDQCGEGKKCVNDKCVGDAPPDTPCKKNVPGRVTAVQPLPNGVEITIDIGSGRGINKGDSGTVSTGHGFKVMQVGGSRSIARINNVKKDELRTGTTVTITATKCLD